MAMELLPEWMAGLEEEDVAFIKKFILASGSLKEVAGQYGVTYPTVRLRLDRLIQKIRLTEDTAADPYIATINDGIICLPSIWTASARSMRCRFWIPRATAPRK